ncbi:MAG: hypothetical protein C4290_03890 [Chloroflexota bacterium]
MEFLVIVIQVTDQDTQRRGRGLMQHHTRGTRPPRRQRAVAPHRQPTSQWEQRAARKPTGQGGGDVAVNDGGAQVCVRQVGKLPSVARTEPVRGAQHGPHAGIVHLLVGEAVQIARHGAQSEGTDRTARLGERVDQGEVGEVTACPPLELHRIASRPFEQAASAPQGGDEPPRV